MLTKDEFKVLNAVRVRSGANQRDLAALIGVSLGKTNQLVAALVEKRWISTGYSITRSGIAQLKPYKVDNAIIMAAGMSSRFAPLSYEKPKGLLVVKGEVLIERQIRQLQEAGIRDITVVVGYMKEKFLYLREKFGVDFVENEDYYRYNNTSTLIRVLDRLKNTYVCSADNYFAENVFEPYVYRAYYSAVYYPGPVNEWGVKTDRKGTITGISHYPVDMWCMMGHAFFSRSFSAAFKKILKCEYDRGSTKFELWEAVLERNLRRLNMDIRKYPSEVIHEFDSLADLKRFDPDFTRGYRSNVARLNADHEAAEQLAAHLFSAKIVLFERLGGLTNRSYKVTLDTSKVVAVRFPGEGTSAIINRSWEKRSTELACSCGVDTTLHYFDEDGVKVMDFIDGAVTMNAVLLRKAENVRAVAKIFSTLHGSGADTGVPFKVFDMAEQYRRIVDGSNVALYPDFEGVTEQVQAVKKKVDAVCDVRIVPCHNDSLCENWIKDASGRMYLIDWEYAGMNDAMWDLADISIEADYTKANDTLLLNTYLGRRPRKTELVDFVANKIFLDYLWTLWAKTRVPYAGQAMEDYAVARYRRLKKNIQDYRRNTK